MERSIIEKYIAGGNKLIAAYAGLTRDDLLAFPIPGTWSLQQIAIHMLDSDLIGTDRLKRLASMPNPLLIGYDENGFNSLPGIDEIDAHRACEFFAYNRQNMGIILRKLPDEAFERTGIHSESGKVSLGLMVKKYIEHLDSHLEHVYKKRALLGKPIA